MMSDWHHLGAVMYRKWNIYDMQWQNKNIDIDHYQIFGSQLGGPLALLKIDKKLNEQIKLEIFTTSGIHLTNIEYSIPSRIVGISWNESEQLVIVHENGNYVTIYES